MSPGTVRAVEEMTNGTGKGRADSRKVSGPSPMLTLGEACRLLNIHANTLRRWSARGLITEYRIGPGSQRRYRAEDITALILEQPTTDRQGRAG